MRTIALAASAWMGLAASASAAQSFSFLYDAGAYSVVDVPGSTSTTVAGINNLGQIVGNYTAPTGADGFVDTGGVFTTVAVPAALSTSAIAINNAGTVLGTYESSELAGFTKTGATYSTIAPPDAISTTPTAINNSGDIVGTYLGGSGFQAFEDVGGTYSQIKLLGAGSMITPIGISDADVVVGDFETKTFDLENFVYTGGGYTSLFAPGASETIINDISPSGIIAGYYIVSGPSGDIDDGYTYANGAFTTIDVPGAVNTQVLAVNDSGDVTGYYYTADAKYAFVYAGGQFTTLDVPDSSDVTPVAINDLGEVLGTALPPAPLPEPAAWMMMLAGFGMLGAALRSRGVQPVKA